MPPLAYLITWTTYGTWLPGDPRGWVEDPKEGILPFDPERQKLAKRIQRELPVTLDAQQRRVVDQTIVDHCEIRRWMLHAWNARTNHIHVVVTAEVSPEEVMNQLKAWCSRKLNETILNLAVRRKKWWTEHGSTKWINDEVYLRNAIKYVREGQGNVSRLSRITSNSAGIPR